MTHAICLSRVPIIHSLCATACWCMRQCRHRVRIHEDESGSGTARQHVIARGQEVKALQVSCKTAHQHSRPSQFRTRNQISDCHVWRSRQPAAEPSRQAPDIFQCQAETAIRSRRQSVEGMEHTAGAYIHRTSTLSIRRQEVGFLVNRLLNKSIAFSAHN